MDTKKILLVEDSRIIQLLIQTVLSDYGCEVESVNDGEEALGALSKHKPDLLILDIMMPVMDGFTLLEKIDKPIGFPVLVVSARADYNSIGKALELGASDYLIKPFNSTDLINKVDRLLGIQVH
ncbi:MAG: response regulator [Bacteroidales bacterium]